ncbi:MAG: DUF4340 domain-containing protein [Phycisphaerales bacterium]|nr:DUF4340 domain-containing protein [Phycisphaerales bacterium]
MSRASALIWIVICGVLGLLVWWTTPRAVEVVAGPALLEGFSAAELTSVRITSPEGETSAFERGPMEGLWLLKQGRSEIRSVVDASRVQGFLRLLSELRASSGPDENRSMARAFMVSLGGGNGTLATLAIDPEFLGGRGRVAKVLEDGTAVRVAVTSQDLGALVKPAALAEWKSKTALAWTPERTSSMTVSRDTHAVELQRSGTGWLMTRPLQLRADPASAQGVSLWLANVGVDRWLDDGGPAEVFSKPGRVLVLGAETLERKRVEQRIELGAEVDARMSLIRVTGVDAETGKPVWGPSVGVVQTSLLTGVSDDESFYLPKVCFAFPAADVSKARIATGAGEVTLSRDAGGGFGSSEVTARGLLRLLTEVPAAIVRVMPPGSAREPSSEEPVRVSLLGQGDAVLGTAELLPDVIPSRTEGSPSTPAIQITIDRVRRVIPAERPREFLAALREMTKK